MKPIQTLNYISKLGDAYFVVYNTLNIIGRMDVQKLIVNTMMRGTDIMLQELVDRNVFIAIDPKKDSDPNHTKLRDLITKQLEQTNVAKVKEYTPILLNQNLVMLCTIMESFFIHILETVINAKPNVLMGLAEEKNITLQRVIELKNYDSILDEFKSKTLEHFSRQGIKKKFEIFNDIGLDTNKVFDYSSYTDDVQKAFSGYNLEHLVKIFDKRHDVVHKNLLPLNNLNELASIKNFFEKTVLNLSTVVMNKFNILLDLQDTLVQAGYPRKSIPVPKQGRSDS